MAWLKVLWCALSIASFMPAFGSEASWHRRNVGRVVGAALTTRSAVIVTEEGAIARLSLRSGEIGS